MFFLAGVLFSLQLFTVRSEVIVCHPPKGDGRGFFYLVTDLQPSTSAQKLGGGETLGYRGLLEISTTPAAPYVFYDKTCGYAYQPFCPFPFLPGNEITHNDVPDGLGYLTYHMETDSGEKVGLGFINPSWDAYPGDGALANIFQVNLLDTQTLYDAPLAWFPQPYNPPGMSQAQITTPFLYNSGPVDRRNRVLDPRCYFLFPGGVPTTVPLPPPTVQGSGFLYSPYATGYGLPPLPPSLIDNPMVPPGVIYLDPATFFIPGLNPPEGVLPYVLQPTDSITPPVGQPAQQFPLPLSPALNVPVVYLYTPNLRYSLGNVVTATPATATGELIGPFYQVVNQPSWDPLGVYKTGDLVQWENSIYIALLASTAVNPTGDIQGKSWALQPVPGAASPADSPFFALVEGQEGQVILYLPNILAQPKPIDPTVVVCATPTAWNASVAYKAGDTAVGPDGLLYLSVIPSVAKDPSLQESPKVYWWIEVPLPWDPLRQYTAGSYVTLANTVLYQAVSPSIGKNPTDPESAALWVEGLLPWSPTQDYTAGDVVTENGAVHLALKSSTGIEPTVNEGLLGDSWALLLSPNLCQPFVPLPPSSTLTPSLTPSFTPIQTSSPIVSPSRPVNPFDPLLSPTPVSNGTPTAFTSTLTLSFLALLALGALI